MALWCTCCSIAACAEREYVIVIESGSLEESCFEDLDCGDPEEDGLDFAVQVVRNLTGESSMLDAQQDCDPIWGTAAFGGSPIPRGELLDFGVRIEPGDMYLFGLEFGAWESFVVKPDKDEVVGSSQLVGECASLLISIVGYDGD